MRVLPALPCLAGDHEGGRQHQAALDGRAEVLGLLLPVRVVGIRLAGR